jgi:hypothetical protein
VQLLELRLPGGAVRGGRVPLALLWDQGATLTTYPMGRGDIAPARYARDSLSAVLHAILQDATKIDTLNPDTVPFIEHPDHIYAARITRHIGQTLGRSIPIAYYITYPTGNWPPALFGEEAQRKRDVTASYFSIDGGDTAHVFGEYQWDGNWVLRRYARNDSTSRPTPDFVALPSVLFNIASSECLTSRGNDREPELARCDDSIAQQWKWEPRATYAGNQHNAALVSAATGQCVTEDDGRLTQAPCEEWNPSQRRTASRSRVRVAHHPIQMVDGASDVGHRSAPRRRDVRRPDGQRHAFGRLCSTTRRRPRLRRLRTAVEQSRRRRELVRKRGAFR